MSRPKDKRQSIAAFTDLLAWVQTREHLSKRQAVKIILTGCLKVDSHVVGVKRTPTGVPVLDRYIPAERGRRIKVVMPEALKDVA